MITLVVPLERKSFLHIRFKSIHIYILTLHEVFVVAVAMQQHYGHQENHVIQRLRHVSLLAWEKPM